MIKARTFTMLAIDAHGSVALMPITLDEYGTPITSIFDAERDAKNWLARFDHGFMQAIVTGAGTLENWTVEMISRFIMEPTAMTTANIEYMAMWTWLLDHATVNSPEENLVAPHLIPANWVGNPQMEDAPIFEACEEGTCFNCCDPRESTEHKCCGVSLQDFCQC